MYTNPVKLQNKHLKNCRILADRNEILLYMPPNAHVAEIGVLGGDFSALILEQTKPASLFLIDTFCSPDWAGQAHQRFDSASHLSFIQKRFQSEIQNKQIILLQGMSAKKMREIPDRTLDWIYIDADHSYAAVAEDLRQARRLVKPEGFIVMNDYIFFSHHESIEYGVVHAVNEFCLQENFEIVYLALHPQMYCDVVLKWIPPDLQNE
ncbi:MAG TPA: class I SAM-dependent methyltransferase [Bacteroidia bacterium]|nr:class I SAM-dependent methyltransferase [Bacteroidia bacterium]